MRLCVLYVVWFLCYDTWFFEACYEVNMGCSLNATCMYSCIIFVFILACFGDDFDACEMVAYEAICCR